MVIVKATETSEAGVLPKPEDFSAMGKFNEALEKAGLLIVGDGLQPSSKGKRIHIAGGKRQVIDGPFAEAKELVAGYWIWKVKSLEEAVEWANRCPDPMPGEECVLEIRPLYEFEDLGLEMTPELQERRELLKGKLSRRAD